MPQKTWTVDYMVKHVPSGVLQNVKRYPAYTDDYMFPSDLPMARMHALLFPSDLPMPRMHAAQGREHSAENINHSCARTHTRTHAHTCTHTWHMPARANFSRSLVLA